MSIFLKLLLRIFNVAPHLLPCKTSQQDSVEIETFWNLQRSKFVSHNGAKMVNVWNVSKLTAARMEMEVGKLQTRVAQ